MVVICMDITVLCGGPYFPQRNIVEVNSVKLTPLATVLPCPRPLAMEQHHSSSSGRHTRWTRGMTSVTVLCKTCEYISNKCIVPPTTDLHYFCMAGEIHMFVWSVYYVYCLSALGLYMSCLSGLLFFPSYFLHTCIASVLCTCMLNYDIIPLVRLDDEQYYHPIASSP